MISPRTTNQDGAEGFYMEVGGYLAIRRLVMARRGLSVPEAETWLGWWSKIKIPDKMVTRWEEEIGPISELTRIRAEAERRSDILAAKLGPILRRGLGPKTPEPAVDEKARVPSPKVKVSQSYLDIIFATEKTIRKYQAASRGKNNLVKAEQMEELLEGGFTGVKLNVTEQRIDQAIFNLLNDPAKVSNLGSIEIDGFSDLYEAMGLERKKTPRGKMEFDGREVAHVNRVFWALAGKSHHIVYKVETTPPGSRDPLYDVFVTQAPLYQVGYLFKDVTGKKVRYIAASAGRPSGSAAPHKIVIKPHPALVAEYHRYFRLLPRDPYNEVRRLLPPGHKVQAHHLYFISWLHRHRPGKTVIETNKRSLAEEIGLINLVRTRQWKRLGQVIAGGYRLAKRLGYLLDFEEDVPAQNGNRKDVLRLNPAMIIHANPTVDHGPKTTARGVKTTARGVKTTARGVTDCTTC